MQHLTNNEQAEILEATNRRMEKVARILLEEVGGEDVEFSDDDVARFLSNDRVRKGVLHSLARVVDFALEDDPSEEFGLHYDLDFRQMVTEVALASR